MAFLRAPFAREAISLAALARQLAPFAVVRAVILPQGHLFVCSARLDPFLQTADLPARNVQVR